MLPLLPLANCPPLLAPLLPLQHCSVCSALILQWLSSRLIVWCRTSSTLGRPTQWTSAALQHIRASQVHSPAPLSLTSVANSSAVCTPLVLCRPRRQIEYDSKTRVHPIGVHLDVHRVQNQPKRIWWPHETGSNDYYTRHQHNTTQHPRGGQPNQSRHTHSHNTSRIAFAIFLFTLTAAATMLLALMLCSDNGGSGRADCPTSSQQTLAALAARQRAGTHRHWRHHAIG